MRFNIKYLLGSLLVAAVSTMSVNAAMTQKFYAASSVLKDGKWVKVGVDRSGVFEISYETLREMGFSDPSKVGVFGKGGKVMPESFVSNSGVPVISDDLSAVKVLHENNKLYFYAQGPEEITFNASDDYDTGGFFSRKSRNIYSFRGYYFLTDTDMQPMEVKTYENSSTPISTGISYAYHEIDSVQNSTNSGQLFWGEQVGLPNLKRRSWNVTLPDALSKSRGVMECHIYFPDRGFGNDAYVAYGFENTDGFFKTKYVQNNTLYYAPHEPTVASVDVPGTSGSVFIEFVGEDMGSFSNLDFWVVSYERKMPTFADGLPQHLLAISSIAQNTSGYIQLSNPASLVVLDVTSPAAPQRLTLKQSGATGTVGVRNNGSSPLLVIFDKNRPQYQICGYETDYTQVTNQNLHGYKEKGTDFIIITTPALKQYAEELADLHRTHDGIDVIVATTEEVYNEFSGGVPDPMAYRSFAKMLYFSDRKPKNMLLLGPLYSDFRGISTEHDPFEGIIAFQSPAISIARGAHNINDFYGMMDDKFRTDYYERNNVHIGVGILPLKFDSEARIMIEKIRNHLERTDQAYYLNKYTAISGLGDSHTHDVQIRDINTHVRLLDNYSTIVTPLSIDTYGNLEAKKKFLNQLNEGVGIVTYFGHGAEQFLGKDNKFFNAGDVYKLRNKVLPFLGFGGCQITNTDRGYRGLGETLVTATPYGGIGALVSSRETWSGQNLEFFKQLFINIYKEGSTVKSAHNLDPVTIGEVYARIKNNSTYSNELAYQLLCDPAIVIPTVNRPVSVALKDPAKNTLIPGESFAFTGKVLAKDGTNADTKFNGQIVLRICEPEKLVPVGNVETWNTANGDDIALNYYYRDAQVTSAVADVKNGEFEIEVHIPASLSTFTAGLSEGETNMPQALLYFCAFDPGTKTGAGQGYTIPIGRAAATSTESADKVAPVIENLSFNPMDCSIAFTVSDNVALNLSNNPLSKGVYLYIDGKERTEAHFAEPILETSRPAFSKNVWLEGITYGDHSARLKVKDAAGNTAETEIVFTYQPSIAKYTIARSDDSHPETTVIETVGETPLNASLVIISTTGTEVWRGDIKGSSCEWNHVDFAGNKVKPGHYKAYLIETGSGNSKGHSEPIDIPVI